MTRFRFGVISPTQGLRESRRIVCTQLEERGHQADVMEEWGGGPVALPDYIRDKAKNYDAAIVIFAASYGEIHPPFDLSPTHIEVIELIRQNCPIFCLEAAGSVRVRIDSVVQSDEERRKLDAMIALVREFSTSRKYTGDQAFRDEVTLVLNEAMEWIPHFQSERQAAEAALESETMDDYQKRNTALPEFSVILERKLPSERLVADKIFVGVNGRGRRWVTGTQEQIKEISGSDRVFFRRRVAPSYGQGAVSFRLI